MESTTDLSRAELSAAVETAGWRLILGDLCTAAATSSLREAADAAAALAGVAGDEAGLRLDVRPGRLLVTLAGVLADGRAPAASVTAAERLSAQLRDLGLAPEPAQAQTTEIAIDALDIPAVRPFWQAVLGYARLPDGSLADPAGKGPSLWFQQMDAPRPQRNRLHLDVVVPHDQAQDRLQATLAAGGTLRGDAQAPAFWVLADAEGNEACVCTWQARE